MTPEQHDSKTERRVAEINAAIKQIMDGAVDALTNEEYIAVRNLQAERDQLKRKPPEPGHGDMLARQERMVELERRLEQLQTVGVATDWERDDEIAEIKVELSRLRKSEECPCCGGSGYERYLGRDNSEEIIDCSLCKPASPSDLPAREAIERLERSIQFWAEERPGMNAEDNVRRLTKLAEYQTKLTQGNGEAVAWRANKDYNNEGTWPPRGHPLYSLFHNARLNWPSNMDSRSQYERIVDCLYAAPPSQPVREALQYATHLAETLAAKHYADVPQWKPLPDLLGVLTQIDNMTTGLARTTPSPGLVEAAEWQAGVEAATDVAYTLIEKLDGGSDISADYFYERFQAGILALEPPRTSAKGGAG